MYNGGIRFDKDKTRRPLPEVKRTPGTITFPVKSRRHGRPVPRSSGERMDRCRTPSCAGPSPALPYVKEQKRMPRKEKSRREGIFRPWVGEKQASPAANMPWNRKTCLYWKCRLRKGILTRTAAPSRHAAHQRKAFRKNGLRAFPFFALPQKEAASTETPWK